MDDSRTAKRNIDYSFLIIQNREKVYQFIQNYGIFVTDAHHFWESNKYIFKKFSEEKQKEIFNALCEVEEVCLSLLTSGGGVNE
mgnify:CR=1 FL=1